MHRPWGRTKHLGELGRLEKQARKGPRGSREPGHAGPLRPWWRFCINGCRKPSEDFEQGSDMSIFVFLSGTEVDEATLVRGLFQQSKREIVVA